MRHPKSKSDCYVQLCVIMKLEWVVAGGAVWVGQRGLLSRAFNGRTLWIYCVGDTLTCRVPVSSSLESVSKRRPCAPVRLKADSSSLFYGSLLFKPEQLYDGHKTAAGCTWKVAGAKGAQHLQHCGSHIFVQLPQGLCRTSQALRAVALYT